MNMYLKRILRLIMIFTSSILIITGCNTLSSRDVEQNVNSQSQIEDHILNYKNNNDEPINQEIRFNNIEEDSINADNIMYIIEELSSEKYTGRLAGTSGNEQAVEYIVDYFKQIGLQSPEKMDNYTQRFVHGVRIANSTPKLEIKNKDGNVVRQFVYLKDFSPYTFRNPCEINGNEEGEIYVIKDASKINKENNELKGKIALVDTNVINQIGNNEFYNKMSSPELGVKAVIIGTEINASSSENVYSFRVAPHPQNTGENNKIIFVQCNSETFAEISSYSKNKSKVRISVDYFSGEVESSNVIGVIPGSDPELKDEYIILTAHLDHVGDNKNGTYNSGALDNASGTASIMEIARVMTENHIKPKKTVVFIAFNGEEEGLCGSRYYTDYPIYPLERTTVINLDMVGSKRIIPLEIANVTNKESKLRDALYRYGKSLGLDVAKSTSQASDHAPFNYKGVEAVLLIHLDRDSGYHTPGDTIKTVDKDRIKEVVKLVLYYLDNEVY
ncbi:M28 family metallopeptidase [Sporosalibacterium faouarense]|uniref:M28 family metallopeptidase n=1 Tax=Sporosalibacterium faouarense TaxID=516123 RepID=UPI00192AEA3A|nr:M28 family metallopeptidase [Sporosalibacterium faouarense]